MDGVLTLLTPLADVPGIAPAQAAALARLGVRVVAEQLLHLPSRHERLEAEATIGELAPETNITARGTVTATRWVPFGRRPRFEAVMSDGTGRLDLAWFNAPYMRGKLTPGLRIRVWGKARRFKSGMQIANPRWEALPEDDEPEMREGRLRPVYPAGQGITSEQIERVVSRVLPSALALLEDHLPEWYRRERELVGLAEAYRMMHAPADEDEVSEGRRRLAFDELLLFQLGVMMKRRLRRSEVRAPALRVDDEVDRRIRARLPFTLTESQDRVIAEISRELEGEVPTNRLIQGDVGSGKTAVAVYAMLAAVASGHQAALMAPTELLAEQHFASVSALLRGSETRVELLTGGLAADDRARVLRRIERGDVDAVIGTHALLTERVRFASLAVVVIDEQHRFGVHQRAALRSKGAIVEAPPGIDPPPPPPPPPTAGSGAEAGGGAGVHVLVMTATPIPRTLALTLFGDLDVSTITGMPPGRAPVTTRVLPPSRAGEAYEFVRERLDKGDQAYVVAPTIDSGDEVEADVRSVMRRLEERELRGKRIAAVHGRLKSETREHVMGRFRAGLIDVLVATTVIEVGVDVPNATVMVVEQAEKFGLAQLHQLRGRVGRGSKPGACILIAEAETDDARQRIEAVAASTDGFALAEKDLEIRGPGEVFGTKQSGVPPFRVADLTADRELLAMARRDAAAWIDRSPELGAPEESLLKRRLLKAHGRWLGLGDVG